MQKSVKNIWVSFWLMGSLISVICFSSPVVSKISSLEKDKQEFKASVHHEAVMTGLEVKLNNPYVAIIPQRHLLESAENLNNTKNYVQAYFFEIGHWFITLSHHIIVKRGP